MNQVQLPARFAARTQKRNLVQAVSAGLGMASPPYVSIKGGSFTLVDANGEQEPVETKWLDCVIFDVNMDVPVQRVFWGDKPYNPSGNVAYEPPECWSDNGIAASVNAAKPQHSEKEGGCQTCPQNTWGSATSKITGKGVKACHVIKKVAVVPVMGAIGADGTYNPTELYDFPFLLRVPVMSHENLRAYSAKFSGQEFDVSDVVTRITFVHGQVGQLDFAAAGFTDQGTEDLIQKFLTQKLTDALVGRGDVPWRGEVRQVAQQEPQRPLPAPTAAAPSAVHGATSAPVAPSPAGGVFGAHPQAAGEAPKRTRRTKAQMEADTVAAQQSAPPGGQPGGIPSFLQRTAAPSPAQPAHGIQQNAPAPNAELESALANVFGLPMK